MRAIPRPYDTMRRYFDQHLSLSEALPHNLALWVYGLFKARSCHLGKVADELPLEGQKDSLIQRLKRWLMNDHLDVPQLYRQLMIPWLASWSSGNELILIFDRFDEASRFNVLLLAIAFRGRALPLTWQILSHKGSCSFAEQKSLLERVLPDLPATAAIALMGDGEFRSIELFTYARTQGWDFCLGHKGNTFIFRPDEERWQRLDTLEVQPGKPIYLEGIKLTQQASFGPLNLIAFWDEEDQCPRYRFTNRPANGHTLRWSRKRSWIEGLIRDFKSGGFQLDDTRLEHEARLNRLLLAMAIATWWFVAMATRLIKQGRRREIDNERKRAHTYFQIDWSWLKKQVRLGKPIPCEMAICT